MSNHPKLTFFSMRNCELELEGEHGSPVKGSGRNHDVEKEVIELLSKLNSSVRTQKKGRLKLVKSSTASSSEEANSTNREYRLHVLMDSESFIKLQVLKAKLEAFSEAEVVRRALKAYEIFRPADESELSDGVAPAELGENVEHLYVRITLRMKKCLDNEQKSTGRTYAEQVRQALRVLSQIVKEVDTFNSGGSFKPQKGGAIDEKKLRALKLAIAN